MTFTWPDTLIEIGTIALLAIVLRGLLKRLIRRWVKSVRARADSEHEKLTSRAADVLAKAGSMNSERQQHRARTLGTMLGSLVDAIIGLVAIFMILEALGLNIMPALASAGIGGVALGFGAQSLVKDIISGVFLMLEDQLGVGDYIDVDDVHGTVLSLALRVTKVQGDNGEIWYVRNGEIVTLGNRTQGWSSGTVEIPVSPNEDPQTILGLLTTVAEELDADENWHEQMIEAPNVLGLTKFENGQAIYAVVVKCPGNKQWALEREVRARAIAALRKAGVHVSWPTNLTS